MGKPVAWALLAGARPLEALPRNTRKNSLETHSGRLEIRKRNQNNDLD
jgi:hypothetical protein